MGTDHYTFYVNNMRCASCALSIEDLLSKQVGVHSVHVNFADKKVELEISRGKTQEEILVILAKVIAPHSYILSLEKSSS